MAKEQVKPWLNIATLDEALESGLSEEEFKHIKQLVGREISCLELGIFSALYSEHCSYKSTKAHLKTLPTSGPRVIHGPGENAGVIDVGNGKAIAFKVESHNHPSFIEPYQGAATGVGGILRDVFTMGARPIALMNALRFGTPDESKTKYLITRAVKGIGGYGNAVGIPTVAGELMFDESYSGNCLVNAFALGIVDHDKIFLGQASGIGNPVFYVGSKTGRDGIHGATMASDVFDDDSEEKRPTVQVGDPFVEKLLLEACLEVMASGAVEGIQDMGAAGMTSSTYETAHRAGTGLVIHLDRVPQREDNMTPYEIMLSESQERMLIIAKKGKEKVVQDIFLKWDLDVVQIGEVVEGGNVDLYWHGELQSSLPVDLLTGNVPQARWTEAPPGDYESRLDFSVEGVDDPKDLSKVWMDLLSSVNLCSRHQLFSQYDSTVRSNTVVHPGGDAGVVRLKSENGAPEIGIAMKLDCNSRYCSIDPRAGTALTVAEGVRNITAVGATPIGISDCLNFGSPQKPEGMWEIAESIRGLGEAARAFKVPIVSGNVSLYNETKNRAIMPTPMIAMVGLLQDASKSVGIGFKNAGDRVLVIGETDPLEMGGSEYLAVYHGISKGRLPVLNYNLEMETTQFIRDLIDKKLLNSCHDLSSGGMGVALAECCLNQYSRIGAVLEVEKGEHAFPKDGRKDGLLFSETGARFIVSVSPKNEAAIRKLAESKGIKVTLSGTVGGDAVEIKGFAKLKLENAFLAWSNGLNRFFA